MASFSAERSAALGGPGWLGAWREASWGQLQQLEPPREAAEVWRYSPIDKLDLDAYRPLEPTGRAAAPAEAIALASQFGPGPAVVVHNGRVAGVDAAGAPDAVLLGGAGGWAAAPGDLGAIAARDDFFVALNGAFATEPVVVSVPERIRLETPIVIVHWCDASAVDGPFPATFLRTVVSVGEDAEASVVEVLAGPGTVGRSLVVPVGEFSVAERGRLSYVMVQDLAPSAWHLARLGATVGRDGRLRTFTAGLGADYDRVRLDAAALGQGASTEVTTVYLGSADQVHDVRTLQDHAAPRTTSDLLCKGAVAERSRSIYTGLIRVRHGAVRSDAMQTNHNLVLGPDAHADSVPNLDIEENDVRCSHASTVGPVGEDERYYLESRGLSPERAERLIVLGFYEDVLERCPLDSAIDPLRQRIGRRLATLVGRGEGVDG